MRLMPTTRFGVVWRGLVGVRGCRRLCGGRDRDRRPAAGQGHRERLRPRSGAQRRQRPASPPGAPETLLLVGVDHRYGEGDGPGNTDTMMLVRINDQLLDDQHCCRSRATSSVDDPGRRHLEDQRRLRRRWAETLLIKTLREDVFPGFKVNHVLMVDFASFANLINAIGCVYAAGRPPLLQPQRRAADPATDYSSIDIQPGYQKMCGGSGSNLGGPNTALAFVRFRHNDSDFVRESRQQDFLRWAKQNFSSGELLSKQNELLDRLRQGRPDRPLPAQDRRPDRAVQPGDQRRRQRRSSRSRSRTGPRSSSAAPTTELQPDGGRARVPGVHEADDRAAGASTTTTPRRRPPASRARTARRQAAARQEARPVVRRRRRAWRADPGDGSSQAATWDAPGLPVYYPNYIPDDYQYCFAITGNCNIGYDAASVYAQVLSAPLQDRRRRRQEASVLRDDAGLRHARAAVRTPAPASTPRSRAPPGQVPATRGPPILRTPAPIKARQRQAALPSTRRAERSRSSRGRRSKAVYWISNTLQNNIPNGQMVAMAASFTPAP